MPRGLPKGSVTGFCNMTPQRRLEVQRRGARALHASGRAHQFDHAAGQAAGRKGGLACQARRRAVRDAATEKP